MILPILSAISRSAEIILDKQILSHQKVNFKSYLVGGFIFILVISGIMGIIWGEIEPGFFDFAYILAFIGVIAAAIGWNAIFYRAIQHEKLTDVEPIILAAPIVVIGISAIFIPGERKWQYIVLGAIAVLSIIFAHFRKRHLKFNQYSLSLIGYTFLFGFEALFLKIVLANCNAFALYPIRVLVMTIALALIFKPQLKKLTKKNWLSLLLVGLVANAYHLTLYLSYDYYGIAITSLFSILKPVIIYFASLFFFKEKFYWRNIVAAAIVVACVIYAQFI
ncbi:EamA family transporter [Patescibacteria group bacterium]